jgi:hypothetical protein
MRPILQDTVENANSGVWVTIAALIGSDYALNTAGVLKSKLKIPLLNPSRLPYYILVGGLTNWAWTSGKYSDFSATAAVVNKDIAKELNLMMNLKQ